MIGEWFDRMSHTLGLCVAQSWRDLPRASSSHAPIDIMALHATLDRLEERLAHRRLQILEAEGSMLENPHGHHDST